MANEIKNDKPAKTISTSQFNWAASRGLIWEIDGELFSSKHQYQWIRPYLNRDLEQCGGHYEIIG